MSSAIQKAALGHHEQENKRHVLFQVDQVKNSQLSLPYPRNSHLISYDAHHDSCGYLWVRVLPGTSCSARG